MRRFWCAAAVMTAACWFGGLSQVEAHGHGGMGMYPGFYPIVIPGYSPFGSSPFGTGRSLLNRNSAMQRPVAQTAQKVDADKPIMIVGPDIAGVSVNYRLNDHDYSINSGESRLMMNDRTWIVSFDRGGGRGMARYTMSPGTYSFQITPDHGWELFHDADMSRFVKSNNGPMNGLPAK